MQRPQPGGGPRGGLETLSALTPGSLFASSTTPWACSQGVVFIRRVVHAHS
jgi:hypothetical protein